MGGLLWMYVATAAQLVTQTAVLAVLARLVTPREFGLVTAALVVVTFGGLLAQAGLDTALIQRPQLDPQHVRAAFTASVGLALVVSAAFFQSAPLLAALYGLPDIEPLIQALCVVLIIEGLTLGEHLLTRELRFRPLALIEVGSFALGYGGVAIVLAMRGWGMWALVAGQIGQSALATISYWAVRPHTVRPTLDARAHGDLFRVGAGETISRVIATVGMEGDSFVVGRFLGAAPLGIYSRAYRLMELPTSLFSQAIRKVMFPAMSAIQSDRERLARTYLIGVGALSAATLPTSVGLALAAPELVALFLGPQWTDLVPVFQVLVFGMVFRAGPAVNDSLILACGAVYRQAGRIAVFAALIVAGALLGQRHGLAGVATGILGAMAANYLMMAYISLSLTGLHWRAFASAQLPAAVLAAGVAATAGPATLALRALPADVPVAVSVAVTASVSALAVWLLLRTAPHLRSLRSLALLVARLREVLPPSMQRPLERVLGPALIP